MARCVTTQPSLMQQSRARDTFLPKKGLMQDQVASGTQGGNRTGLFGLAGADRFAQRYHGTRQVQVDRLLGQHCQALENIGCCCMPSRFGQIVVNHGQSNLCRGHITEA